jgi:hypothetical protein
MGRLSCIHLQGNAKDRRKQFRRLVRLNPQSIVTKESDKTYRKKIGNEWITVEDANSLRTKVFIKEVDK